LAFASTAGHCGSTVEACGPRLFAASTDIVPERTWRREDLDMGKRPTGDWAPSVPVTHRVFRPYALALGQLALAWNDLHLALEMLFCTAMGGGFINPVLAIWNALKSDRSQREILLAAVKSTPINGGPAKLAEEIEWICRRVDVLEDARNDALHSPLWGSPRGPGLPVVSPVVGLGHARASKLLGKNLLDEFRWCRQSSTLLRDYVTELDFAVCRGSAASCSTEVARTLSSSKNTSPTQAITTCAR
jgi:hypothetical protein